MVHIHFHFFFSHEIHPNKKENKQAESKTQLPTDRGKPQTWTLKLKSLCVLLNQYMTLLYTIYNTYTRMHTPTHTHTLVWIYIYSPYSKWECRNQHYANTNHTPTSFWKNFQSYVCAVSSRFFLPSDTTLAVSKTARKKATQSTEAKHTPWCVLADCLAWLLEPLR